MPNFFAKNIKTLRKKKNLNQTQLGDELCLPRHIIGSMEERRSEPNYDRLITIANYFKVTIDQLLKEEIN